MPKKLRAKFQKRWKNWWKKNKKKSRKRLLLQGFKKSRVKIKDLNSWRSVDKLVKAARKDNHTGYNAHRVLGQVLGRWQGTYQWSAKERHARWAKWWRKNKKRFKKKWPRGKP